MRLPIYLVDAFATRKFGGNRAAVMRLQAFLDDTILQAAFAVAHADSLRSRYAATRSWTTRQPYLNLRPIFRL